MERPPQNQERLEFPDFSKILEQFVEGKLPLNEIQKLTASSVRVETRSDTWVSRARRLANNQHEIYIGEQSIPRETLRRWKLGVESVEAQFLLKTAHEYAHVVQHRFDQYLLDWLDERIDEVPQWAESYIRLYAALTETGLITGLAQEQIYHMQNATTGRLKMPTYEDMAELIAASTLTKEYFLFRMKNASVHLPSDIVEGMWGLISDVIEQFKSQLEQERPQQ